MKKSKFTEEQIAFALQQAEVSSTGVNRQLTNETRNPIPGRDLATQPLGSVICQSQQTHRVPSQNLRNGNRLEQPRFLREIGF